MATSSHDSLNRFKTVVVQVRFFTARRVCIVRTIRGEIVAPYARLATINASTIDRGLSG